MPIHVKKVQRKELNKPAIHPFLPNHLECLYLTKLQQSSLDNTKLSFPFLSNCGTDFNHHIYIIFFLMGLGINLGTSHREYSPYQGAFSEGVLYFLSSATHSSVNLKQVISMFPFNLCTDSNICGWILSLSWLLPAFRLKEQTI